MTARDLAKVLLKVLGIYYLISGLFAALQVANFLTWKGGPSGFSTGGPFVVVSSVDALGMFAVGIVLLVHTEMVLRLLFRDLDSTEGPPATALTYQAVGFSIVGILLVAYSVPQLVASGVILVALSEGGRELERATYLRDGWMQLVGDGFEAIAGTVLFFGARGLAALWSRQRPTRAATPASQPPPD